MSDNNSKKSTTKAEYSSEINAEDLAFKLFKKTGDINYYNFYSAIKAKDKKQPK